MAMTSWESAINITPEILKLIAEIDEFRGNWQLLGRLTPERLQQLRHVATIESIGSSTRIEGARLSNQEVGQLILRLETQSFRSRDEQEVAGYASICEEIFENFEAMPFSENAIKQFHAWLLKFSDKDERHRGEYKTLSNNVEAFDPSGKSLGIVFETASPFETPMQMHDLINWTKNQIETQHLHPLITIGIFIVVFLAIHPFQDGNGRLSRILTALLLLKSGYTYVPYSSLESIIERNKERYYLALRKTQNSLPTSHPDFTPWLLFFLHALQKQKHALEKKVEREKIIAFQLPLLSSKIVTLVNEHGRLTIRNLVSLTGANRNTLKKTSRRSC